MFPSDNRVEQSSEKVKRWLPPRGLKGGAIAKVKVKMAWRTNPEGLMRRSRVALGEFLSRPQWEWYTTHTFRAEYVSPKEADRHWQAWLNTLCQASRNKGLERPFYFRVTELQNRGTLHFHSLIGSVGNIRRLLFKDFWELNGYARVEAYDPDRGANFYVGKYLTKTEGDIRFSHNLTRHLTQLETSDMVRGNNG